MSEPPQPADLPQRYQEVLQAAGLSADSHQQAAIEALERLRGQLSKAPRRGAGWLGTLRRNAVAGRLLANAVGSAHEAPQGVYLWGGVGRGKTWLMDLFFESLTGNDKQRAHFHRFMQGIHAGLKTHGNTVDPLATVAAQIAAEARVVCLDELYVSDIADAMLLGGLFRHLLERGTALVMTSNLPPAELYRDGLQRQRFLPAIALLEKHCQLVCVDGPVDYRLRHLVHRPIYLASEAPDTARQLEELFAALSDGHGRRDAVLPVEGRGIPCVALGDTVVWFDFTAICGGPRSQADYVSVAREFSSVIVSRVPVLDGSDDNAARRFIALVDEFYDRRVNLIVAAAAEPQRLYQGERLRFEFTRTVSRLIEMQSESYLASEHRG